MTTSTFPYIPLVIDSNGEDGGGSFSPALRATDYKCPHCIMIVYD